MKTARVTAYLNPFSSEARELDVAAGVKVRAALRLLNVPPTMKCRIWINQKLVDLDSTIKANDVVLVRVIPKSIFGTATNWFAKTAPWLVNSGSSNSSSGGSGATKIWWGLGGAGLGIGALIGGLFLGGGSSDANNGLNNAVSPEPDPAYDTSYAPVENYGGPADSLLPTLTGVTNQNVKWGEFTCVFGKKVKLYPVLGIQSYSLVSGTEVYNYGCLDLGYGELEIEECMIGARKVEDMPDITIEIQYGKPDDVPFTIPIADLEDTPLSVDLPYNETKTAHAGGASSKLAIEITFPNGLWSSNIIDGETKQSVNFFIEYKRKEDTAWTGFYWKIEDYIKTVKRAAYEWTVSTPGNYDVRISRVDYEKPADTPWASVHLVGFYTGGEYHAVWTDLKAWGAAQPFHPVKDANGDPVYCSRIAIKARATAEQQGALEDFSLLASRKLRHWNGTDFDAPAATDNPSDMVLEVLTGQANFRPVPLAEIDLPSFKAWFDFCVANGFTYNKVVDSGVSTEDLIREICAAGRAAFVERDGKYSILIDQPQDFIAQHFTPRTIIKDSFACQMSTGDTPNVIYAQFLNPDIDWQTDEIEVYDDGFDSTNAKTQQTIAMAGCNNAVEAHKRARYQMADSRLRFWTYTFRTSVQHLACQIGDRIKLSHDVIYAGLGQARISAILRDEDGDIEGLRLDAPVTMEAGKTYGLLMMPDGVNELHVELQTTPGQVREVYFDELILEADPIQPVKGIQVQFGEFGYESLDLQISNITPAEDMTAQIMCLDYNPAVYEADQGPIPPYVSRIDVQHPTTINVAPPTIIGVNSGTAALMRSFTALPQSTILLTLVAETYPIQWFEYQFKKSISSTWSENNVIAASGGTVRIMAVDDGVKYDVRVRNRRYDNYVSDWTLIPEHTVIGKTEPPPDIPSYLYRVPYTNIIGWNYPNPPIDFAGFIVKFAWGENRNWSQGVVIDGMCLSTQFDFGGLLRGMKTIMVKAVDMTGNEQAGEPSFIMVDFGDALIENVVRIESIPASSPILEITGGSAFGDSIKADDDGSLWFGNLDEDFFPDPQSSDWFDQTYSPMIVEFAYSFNHTETLPFKLSVQADIQGPYKIEYLAAGMSPWFPDPLDGDWWDGDPEDSLWGDEVAQWLPMPDDGIPGAWQTFRFRITCFGGQNQGIIDNLGLVVDVPDLFDYVNDYFVDDVNGKRVTPGKVFRAITAVRLTPQLTDAYPDVRSAAASDKASLEPLIRLFDGTGGGVEGYCDIEIQGY